MSEAKYRRGEGRRRLSRALGLEQGDVIAVTPADRELGARDQ